MLEAVNVKGCPTLTVFFEGTANPVREHVTQIGLLADEAVAANVTAGVYGAHPDLQYKMCFDGSGVAFGCRGTLFAHGLRQQCRSVHCRINELLDMHASSALATSVRADAGVASLPPQHLLLVNVVGLSRGGIAALYLAQVLGQDLRLRLNLCLFDPVPGNLLTSARFMDCCGLSTAARCADISHCRNVAQVLALYPHEPLPDISFHAPVVPRYPSGAEVVEDGVLGCHQSGLWHPHSNVASRLSYHRIRTFLSKCGTTMDEAVVPWNARELAQCLASMGGELNTSVPTTRCAHCCLRGVAMTRRLCAGAKIVRHGGGARYLNKYHEHLAHQPSALQEGQCEAQVEDWWHDRLDDSDTGCGTGKYLLEVQRDKSQIPLHALCCWLPLLCCAIYFLAISSHVGLGN